MFTQYSGLKNLGEKYQSSFNFISFLSNVNNTANFKKGLDEVIAFREKVAQYGVAPQINEAIKTMGKKKEARKSKAPNVADIDEQLKYINSKVTN